MNLLDCTLRDGGYITNWEFDNKQIAQTLSYLNDAGIEYIECGYLKETGKTSDTTNFNSVKGFDTFINNMDKKLDSKLYLMINYGDIEIEKIPDKEVSSNLEGIRVAFHKEDLRNAVNYIKALLLKGYKVCVQPMSTINYTDLELLWLVKMCNEIEIEAFYIVDSFGSMNTSDVKRLFYLVDNNLNKFVKIGFHGHNNKQLAFANAIEIFKCATNREVMCDSSIYGMGRGAGNLNSEIIMEYLNSIANKKYRLEFVLQLIDNFYAYLKQKYGWGYSIEYFLSAKYNCHPNYVKYFIGKKTLTIDDINNILNDIPLKQRWKYDSSAAREFLNKYLSIMESDEQSSDLKELLKSYDNIFIIASGKSVKDNIDNIKELIRSKNNACVISVNHANHLDEDFVFFSNTKRFLQHKDKIDLEKTITTSNIKQMTKYKINYKNATTNENFITTNVTLILLNIFLKYDLKSKIYLAGLDGYVKEDKLYSYSQSDSVVNGKFMEIENNEIKEGIDYLSKKLSIEFITPSIFKV